MDLKAKLVELLKSAPTRDCGYCDLEDIADHLIACGVTVQPEPTTNADRIRAMSDEELAYWVMCPYDDPLCGGEPDGYCIACTLQWLQQPAEEG